MTPYWLVWRYLTSGRIFLNPTSLLAIAGVALGVACLVVAMATVSGFETTLKNSVIDVAGHLNVVKRGGMISPREKIPEKLQETLGDKFIAATPFVQAKGVLAGKGKVSFVVLEGVDPESVEKVLNFEPRLMFGGFNLKEEGGVARALVGKEIAERFSLEVGKKFRVVVPRPSENESEQIRPRAKSFILAGVVDLGKYEYNSRYVLVDAKEVQELGEVGDRFSGWRVRLDSEDGSGEVAASLTREMGYPYYVRDWMEVNGNLFEAIRVEKPVIFFIVMIILIAASFNVCSTLFVSVLRRYPDVSILKAMGADRSFVAKVFAFQGVVLGGLGAFLGLALGILLSYTVLGVQFVWEIIPADVYKLGFIKVDLRPMELVIIFFASVAICFLSTLAPALRGAKLNPVEGLKYE